MEILRTWILGVTVSAMAVAAAQALMPEGAVKRAGRLTAGLILVLSLMGPLVSLDEQELYDQLLSLPAAAIPQEELEAQTYNNMEGIIESELAAYIVDKGRELGVDCTAEVTCENAGDGVPVPRQSAVTGRFSPEQRQSLSDWIASQLGIPASQQIFFTQ